MKRIDCLHVRDALESALEELEVLQQQEEWFVSPSIDRLESALQIINEELLVGNNDDK